MRFYPSLALILLLSTPSLFASEVTEQVLAVQQSEVNQLKQNMARLDRYAVYSPSCSTIFQDLIQWKAAAATRRIDFKMVSSKLKTSMPQELNYGFGSFGEGQFNLEGSNLAATFPKYYSDRKTGTQGFNVAAPDTLKITLEPRGSAFVNLVTWGNGRVDLEGVICTRDNFGPQMVARYREGNGTSMIIVSFHKGGL